MGTVYGAYVAFATKVIPTLSTIVPTVSTSEPGVGASGGTITNDGGATITARGVCWSLNNPTPDITNSHSTDGVGTGAFTSTLSGLDVSKNYYVRAYATNSAGTAYGNVQVPTVPTVVTTAAPVVSTANNSMATSGGTVTDEGGASVTARGICWSSVTTPVITDPHTTDGTRSGMFTSTMTGLQNGTLYYVRAYATNALGTVYGARVSFTTKAIPTLTTTVPSVSTDQPGVGSSGGTITDDGGATVTARGVCWSATKVLPDITDSISIDGAGSGIFTSSLRKLDVSKNYYVRAYATNAAGTGYGNVVLPTVPMVVTAITPTISATNNSIAISGGQVTSEGGASVISRGVCWSNITSTPVTTDSHTTDGTRSGNFTSTLTGLQNGTTYYIRAYATNAMGTVYGAYVAFATKTVPTLTTIVPSISIATPGIGSSGGTITSDGGATVTARGVCWSATKALPDITDSTSIDGVGTGAFFSTLRGLDVSKKYYVRAYATNPAGTAYGNVVVPTVPTVVTAAAPTISATDNSVAISGGKITDEGGASVTARGVCWSTVTGAPVITGGDPYTFDGAGSGNFTSTLTGLLNGTTYYVRAYATNAMGTVYGAYVTLVTKSIPTVTTIVPTISTDQPGIGTSGGNVTSDGGATVTARGVCWSTLNAMPDLTNSHSTNGVGTGLFTATMGGLDASLKYYVRAYATNSAGTAYGNVVIPTMPTVVTTAGPTVSASDNSIGISGGTVTNEGGAAVTARGVCWSALTSAPVTTDPHTTDGTRSGTFTSTLTGLANGTTYYVRAYATNALGTVYGAYVSFVTKTTPSITTTAPVFSTVDPTTANGGGAITSDGGAAITARGVCWSTATTMPDISYAHTTNGTGLGSFTSVLTGLNIASGYYVRAYATNSLGTLYGNSVYFANVAIPSLTTAVPTVSTAEPGVVSSGGTITSDGGATITARGVCWSATNATPDITGSHTTDGTGIGLFTSTLGGLDASKKYYVRAYATNSAGTVYGNTVIPTTPTVTTAQGPVVSATDNSIATSGGTVTDEGGAGVTARGICWSSVTSAPVITDSHTTDGTRTGTFSSTLTGLQNGTTYYVRAYATNAMGTVYGTYVSFVTKNIPTLTTVVPSVSTDQPGVGSSGGTITDDGGTAVMARGVCWSLTNTTPDITNSRSTDGTGAGIFTSILGGLDMSKKYYVRAYATNSAGTAYGNLVIPTTPTVITTAGPAVSAADNSIAIGGGTVTDEGGASVTARGVCWNTAGTPLLTDPHTTDGTRFGSFTSTLTGLLNGTTYYVRAYATNAMGTFYGNQVSFLTKSIPTLTTAAVSVTTAQPGAGNGGGVITSDGGAAVTARGVCWSATNATPDITNSHSIDGTGTGTFTSILAGLDVSKNYYVRAYATNAAGTAYGNVVVPTTPTLTTSVGRSISTTDNSIAASGGSITDEGGAAVTARGICWNTAGTPVITSFHTSDGNRAGIFTSTLTGLQNGTTYYIRAYATNAMGTVYGNQVAYTSKNIPTLTTSALTVSTAEPGIGNSGGTITDDGGVIVTARGVCWSITKAVPDITDSHTTDGSGAGVFTSILSGLDASKKYYVRAYATNAAGTAYGNVVIPVVPTVATVTGTVVSATDNSMAISGGSVTDEGGAAVIARGICWSSATATPVITDAHTSDGTRSGSFTSTLTGLLNGTTYYIRAYATNAMGTVYGTAVSFITKNAPTLTTVVPAISSAEPGVGSSGGNITDDGGATVTARGVCWSATNMTPVLTDSHSSDGAGAGAFNSVLGGLDVSKKYYVRAYATNSAGTTYGNMITPVIPTLSTTVANVSATDNSVALSGGAITNEGGAAVTARGVCWSTVTGAPVITDPHTSDGTRFGNFASTLTGLLNNTTYYVRAYATNAMGTAYGAYVSFVTKVIPTLTTTVPTVSSAEPGVGISGGSITNDGGAAVTARGVCWSLTNMTPDITGSHTTDGTGTGIFASTLTGMDASKNYYVRAYATNSAGTAYGTVQVPTLPTVTTAVGRNISTTDNTIAASGGVVTDEGGLSVTARGICWSTAGSPVLTDNHTTDGTRSGSFTSTLTGLVNGTLYYIRAYATNAFGTVYGNQVTFTTKNIPTLTTAAPSISSAEPGVVSSGGTISDDGGTTVSARGLCWSTTNMMPDITNSISSNGTGAGIFTSTLAGLDVSKKYYIRAYATNSAGTAYGNVVIPGIPILTTSAGTTVSSTDNSVAISGGTITDEGGMPVTSRGVCWSTVTGAPVTTDPHTSNGIRSGVFSSTITGLQNGLTYYVRAYATNAMGTAYGPYVSFVTKNIPILSTSVPTVSAAEPGVGLCGGSVSSDGGATVTARGVCWSATHAMPDITDSISTDGAGTGTFASTMTRLDMTKNYYVRAYATNSAGTAYGAVQVPTTPIVTTAAGRAGSLTDNSVAISGGTVTDEGGASVTARGICWSASTTPVLTDPHTSDGTRSGSFTSTMTGLQNGTTYYIRAYATNSQGTVYGARLTYTTKTIPTLTTTIPTVSTAQPGVVSSGGTITDDGGTVVTARGVCWSLTDAIPDINDSHTTNGTGAGIFSSTLSGLDASKKYYVRAYATNGAGTAYGNVVVPTTPAVTTAAGYAASATDNSIAGSGGTVTDEGGASVTARGICWSSITTTPVTTDAHTSDGTRSGVFASTLTGLQNGTTYYIRAYATNALGIVYGATVTYVTKTIPTLTTTVPTISTAEPGVGNSGGITTDDGGATITARGVCWSTINATPDLTNSHSTDGSGEGVFTSTMGGLDVSKKYYVRAYATNSAGTAYGNVVIPTVPTVTTAAGPTVSASDNSVATCGGIVTNEGGASVTARGVCWSSVTGAPVITGSDPYTVDGTRSGSFTSTLTGLQNGTTYYVRAYATNALGTVYGAYVPFVTRSIPAITTTVPVFSVPDPTTANGGGSVTTDGGSAITARGVCWSTTDATPDLTCSHTTNGAGLGTFTSVLTGVNASYGYYVRAYATNTLGTFYGNSVYFTTKPVATLTTVVPTISTAEPGVGSSGGNITNDGGLPVTARGVCWSATNPLPDITNAHSTDGAGTGAFTSILSGLDVSKSYYVRAYSTNSAGTNYGAVQVPTTPTVTTTAGPAVSAGDNTIGLSGGTVTDEGGASVTARGICWSAVTTPYITDPHTTDGTRSGVFTSTLTGLQNGTTYYVRAYATNAFGTVYGVRLSFVTKTIPTLTTTVLTNSAAEPSVGSSGGNITDDGGATVVARGVCWSATNMTPDITGSHSTDGTGTGAFTSVLGGLDVSKNYYVRAYATNSAGTAYGNVVIPVVPTVTTSAGPSVSTTDNSIGFSGGTITSEGGASVTARGICWSSVTSTPVITDAHTSDGTRSGTFTSTMTGLLNNTTYYVRAYATNAMGTVYGGYVSFVTKKIPTLTTTTPTISTAEPGVGSSGGNVTSDGGAGVTVRGVCWSNTNPTPDITNSHSSDGGGTGAFTSVLSGLDVSKNYYVRAYATNAAGTAYGNVVIPTIPAVTTSANPVVSVSDNSVATSGGTVTDEGAASVTARGVCWNTAGGALITDPHTTDGTRSGTFTSTLTGLVNGTTYYVRAYVTNVLGTVYGNQVSFVTKVSPTVTTVAPTVSTAEPGVVNSGGTVTSDGGVNVTARGVCWSATNSMPDITGNHTTDGAGTGAFTSALTGLDASKKYYVRAYATNAAGTSYGNTLVPATPTVVTSVGPSVSLTDNSVATGGGQVTNEGGLSVTTRGICWSTGGAPVITDPHTSDGTRLGAFTSTLSGLLNGTTYYIRAYATNALGTVYGTAVSFVTKNVPTLTTVVPTITTAEPGVGNSGGNVTDDGGATVIVRGVCWSTTNTTPDITGSHSTDGSGAGAFSSIMSGLDVTKKYYVRSYATNAAGTGYGNVVTPGLPAITTSTSPVVSPTDNSVCTGGGTVTNENGAAVTARGVCWSSVTSTPLTIDAHTVSGTRSGTFTSTMTGLLNNTTYYVRAYATNAMGTVYGAYVSFVTKNIPTLTTVVPTVSTAEPGVGNSGGTISNDGGATVTARGVCWSNTDATPDINDSHSSDGAGAGAFVSTLGGLDVSKKYYVRAYATNAAGTSFGSVQIPTVPTVTTTASPVSSATDNTVATCGGTVTDEGGASVTVRGICWSSVTTPVLADPHTSNGTRSGTFTSTLTGLQNGTLYYVRAYATNVMGTVYGNQVSFTTRSIPTLSTTAPVISSARPGVGSSGGNITSDGGTAVTARGVCWSSTKVQPDITDSISKDGLGTGVFTSTLRNLDMSKKYYVCAYATNAAGTAYGTVIIPTVPTVTTAAGPTVSATDNSIATGGGTVSNEGGVAVTARGICWSAVTSTPVVTDAHTSDGDRSGSFTSTMTGLLNNTTYYVRAYATNAMGTVYGAYVAFATKNIATLTTTVPSVSTAEPGVGSSGGNISADGGAVVTARGVCWSATDLVPDINDSHSTDGVGIGAFTSTLTGLDVTKNYYVRAYAINPAGIAYGNVVSPAVPTVTTSAGPAVSATDNSVATSGGQVTSEGGASVTARGVCWNTAGGALTIDPHTTDGTRSGTFTSTLTGLQNATTYYVRAYATNAQGTVYGNQVSFTTKSIPTVVTTAPATSAAEPGVGSSGGNVTVDGGTTVTARGVCWSATNPLPDITNSHSSDGVGTGLYTSTLSGLDVTKTYYVRAYAINAAGIAYGNSLVPTAPVVTTTTTVVSTTDNSFAVGGGQVTNEGGTSVTARGVCWSSVTSTPVTTDAHTTDGTRSGVFTSTLTGLLNGTTYYVRAYATNAMGTVYGAYVAFATKVVPTLVTVVPTVSSAEPGVASSGGTISTDGGAAVTARGVCWSLTNPVPDITNSHSNDGTGSGGFTSIMTGLDASKKYYVRAYATNSAGTAYGTTAIATIPTVTTTASPVVSTVDNSMATSGGTVTSEGGASVIARGVCWNTGGGATLSDSHTTDGTRSGVFISTLTGLLPVTTYYVRAYATNAQGTVYGAQVSFVTKNIATLTTTVPTVSTAEPGVGASGGNITTDGGATVTVRGVCWSSTNPTPDISGSHSSDGTGMGVFTSTLSGLDMTKKFYVRSYAINAAGIAYGNIVTANAPTVTTTAGPIVQGTDKTVATSGGNVTNEGGASVIARGVCWSSATSAPDITYPHTTDGTRTGTFSSTLTGLVPATTYYVRAYATNAIGTSYGAYVSFRTP